MADWLSNHCAVIFMVLCLWGYALSGVFEEQRRLRLMKDKVRTAHDAFILGTPTERLAELILEGHDLDKLTVPRT